MGNFLTPLGGLIPVETSSSRTNRTISAVHCIGDFRPLQSIPIDRLDGLMQFLKTGNNYTDAVWMVSDINDSIDLKIQISISCLKQALYGELGFESMPWSRGQKNIVDSVVNYVESHLLKSKVGRTLMIALALRESSNQYDGNKMVEDMSRGPTTANFARSMGYLRSFLTNYRRPTELQMMAMIRILFHLCHRHVLGSEEWLAAFTEGCAAEVAGYICFLSPRVPRYFYKWDERPDMQMVVFPTNADRNKVYAEAKGVIFHAHQFSSDAVHGFLDDKEPIIFEYADIKGAVYAVRSTRYACDTLIKTAHIYMVGWNNWRLTRRLVPTDQGAQYYSKANTSMHWTLFSEPILPSCDGIDFDSFRIIGYITKTRGIDNNTIEVFNSADYDDGLFVRARLAAELRVGTSPETQMLDRGFFYTIQVARMIEGSGYYPEILYRLIDLMGPDYRKNEFNSSLLDMVKQPESSSTYRNGRFQYTNRSFIHLLPYATVACAHLARCCFVPHLHLPSGNLTIPMFRGANRCELPGDGMKYSYVELTREQIKVAEIYRSAYDPSVRLLRGYMSPPIIELQLDAETGKALKRMLDMDFVGGDIICQPLPTSASGVMAQTPQPDFESKYAPEGDRDSDGIAEEVPTAAGTLASALAATAAPVNEKDTRSVGSSSGSVSGRRQPSWKK